MEIVVTRITGKELSSDGKRMYMELAGKERTCMEITSK
jgi:hypothetical protein